MQKSREISESAPRSFLASGGCRPETEGLHLHNRPIIILETCFGFYNVLTTFLSIRIQSSVIFCLIEIGVRRGWIKYWNSWLFLVQIHMTTAREGGREGCPVYGIIRICWTAAVILVLREFISASWSVKILLNINELLLECVLGQKCIKIVW